MSEKQPFIHPYTQFLVHNINDIYDSIKAGTLTEALKKLYWFIAFLDPTIKNKLKPEVEWMEEVFKNVNLLTRDRFEECLRKVMDALHDEGYFLAAKGVAKF